MITDVKPYPKYSESGLPWLGEVPRHWEHGPGFAAFREKHVKNTGMQEKTVLSLSYGRIVVKPPDKIHGLVPDSFETYQIVDPGDIIIRSTDLQNDWNSLRVGLVRNRGIITSAYLCFRTTGVLTPEYGYQLLHALDLMKVFYGLGSGLRQNLDWGDFKRMIIIIPPRDEQIAIVRFLGYANGRLERAIRAKRKVIALLNEQKQAIIHRAVTRGLDPSVPLKPSGIPWLGDVPAHWEAVPNRAFLKLRKRLVGERSRDFTLLSLTLRGIVARDMENPTGKWPASFAAYQEVHPGDLVFCLFDIDETPRFLGLSSLAGMITGAYTVFECADRGVAEWLYHFYLAMDYDKRLRPAYTGLRKVIQKGTFLGLKTPCPPPDERDGILRELRSSTAGIVSAISRLEREIDLLREYRTRLVADVVAGKLDVREVADRLPEDAPSDAGEADSEVNDEADAVDEEVVA